MSNLFNDNQIQQILKEIPDTLPRSLWDKAHSIATYLAFTGSYGAALTIWKTLFTELPRREHHPSQYDLVAPEAFCHINKALTEDFIGGDKPLEERVWRTASRARRDITIDAWSPAPGYETQPLKNIRRARALARPPKGVRFSETELEALPYLDAFFADPGVAAFAVYDAHLLYADITYRHQRKDEAIEHVKIWGKLMQRSPYIGWHSFAFPSVAWIISQKHLEHLTALTREERSQIAKQTVAAVRQRVKQGTPQRSEQTSIFSTIFYSSFILEPAVGLHEARDAQYDDYEPEPEGDYPAATTVSTPGETGSARFHLRFGNALNDMDKGDFAVTFPFRATQNPHRGELFARVGNVFIDTPTGGPEDMGLDVPVGEYDVAAIFIRGEGSPKNESVGLRHYEVDLCFMPKGTCTEFGEIFDRSWDGYEDES